jgi:hypothetical protein
MTWLARTWSGIAAALVIASAAPATAATVISGTWNVGSGGDHTIYIPLEPYYDPGVYKVTYEFSRPATGELIVGQEYRYWSELVDPYEYIEANDELHYWNLPIDGARSAGSFRFAIMPPRDIRIGRWHFQDVWYLESVSLHLNFGAAGPVDYRISLHPSAVPEPATWSLLIVGFGIAGAAIRRRQHLPRLA